jgi:hypothetical protein
MDSAATFAVHNVGSTLEYRSEMVSPIVLRALRVAARRSERFKRITGHLQWSQKMEKIEIILNINGKPHAVMIHPNETLLDVLRDRLDMTGAKESCGEGVCGSCTVQMDGKPVRSCLTLALEARGTRSKPWKGLPMKMNSHPFSSPLSITAPSNAASVPRECS